MAARAGFKPTTLQTKGVEFTNYLPIIFIISKCALPHHSSAASDQKGFPSRGQNEVPKWMYLGVAFMGSTPSPAKKSITDMKAERCKEI